MTEQPLVFKVIVVGESGCGKTCLIQRYLNDKFTDNYTVTLGVQYHTKTVKVDEQIQIKLKIWDTAGQECFNSIVKSFFRNANVVLLVYDITRKETFSNLDFWQTQALQNSPEDAMYVLVGTHLDSEDSRQVGEQEAKQWMRQAGLSIFFQTSAKTAENVEKMFQEVCSQLLMSSLKKKGEGRDGFQLVPGDQTTKSFCC